MSAEEMYRHRYGWNRRPRQARGHKRVARLERVGDVVASEMFGSDDYKNTPEYLEWAAQFDEPVEVTAQQHVTGVLAIVTSAFMSQVKQFIPQVHSYDVRGGKDETGQKYAKVTLETTDPYGVLQRAAGYALQAAGAQGVSVTTQPSQKKGQLVLVFSQGAVPGETGFGLVFGH